MNETVFTSDYLRREIVSLRQRWGLRSFWLSSEQPALALKAIFTIYLRIERPTPADEIAVESVLGEFARRSAYATALIAEGFERRDP